MNIEVDNRGALHYLNVLVMKQTKIEVPSLSLLSTTGTHVCPVYCRPCAVHTRPTHPHSTHAVFDYYTTSVHSSRPVRWRCDRGSRAWYTLCYTAVRTSGSSRRVSQLGASAKALCNCFARRTVVGTGPRNRDRKKHKSARTITSSSVSLGMNKQRNQERTRVASGDYRGQRRGEATATDGTDTDKHTKYERNGAHA